MAMTTLVTSHLTNWSKKLAPYCDLQRNCNFLCWWSICSFLAILATFARVVLLMGAPWRPSEGTYLLSYIHPVQKIKASSFGDFWGFLRSPNAPFIILKLLPSSSSFFQVSFLNGQSYKTLVCRVRNISSSSFHTSYSFCIFKQNQPSQQGFSTTVCLFYDFFSFYYILPALISKRLTLQYSGWSHLKDLFEQIPYLIQFLLFRTKIAEI